MTSLTLATLALAAWLYLLLARGGFWLARPRDGGPPAPSFNGSAPAVAAVVPARDEADTVARCITSLLRQDYPGFGLVLLVDDDSSDATVANARAAARGCHSSERLIVVKATPRPSGWTGKLWALECGLAHLRAVRAEPQYFLFTDADIVHRTDSVEALVARAQREHLGLVSVMARLRCVSLLERMFVPAFVFFFAMLYPFCWVNRPNRRVAAAAGGCMLIERVTLEDSGGLAAIHGELIDDCALARRIKRHRPIWLGLTERVWSARAYPSIGSIRQMIVRSAYAQLRFSPLLLAGTVIAMTLTYIAPPLLAIGDEGLAQILGGMSWGAMALAMQPTLRFYRVSPLWGVVLPAIAAVYVVFTIDSAWQAMRGRAGAWKGRIYPARPR